MFDLLNSTETWSFDSHRYQALRHLKITPDLQPLKNAAALFSANLKK